MRLISPGLKAGALRRIPVSAILAGDAGNQCRFRHLENQLLSYLLPEYRRIKINSILYQFTIR